MRVWSFVLFSPIVDSISVEIVTNEEDMDKAIMIAKKQLKNSINVKEFKNSSFKSRLINELQADTFRVYISASVDVPTFNIVEKDEQEEKEVNLQKFIFNLELVKDKFTVDDGEKKLIDIIKQRISETVDKSVKISA